MKLATTTLIIALSATSASAALQKEAIASMDAQLSEDFKTYGSVMTGELKGAFCLANASLAKAVWETAQEVGQASLLELAISQEPMPRSVIAYTTLREFNSWLEAQAAVHQLCLEALQ